MLNFKRYCNSTPPNTVTYLWSAKNILTTSGCMVLLSLVHKHIFVAPVSDNAVPMWLQCPITLYRGQMWQQVLNLKWLPVSYYQIPSNPFIVHVLVVVIQCLHITSLPCQGSGSTYNHQDKCPGTRQMLYR